VVVVIGGWVMELAGAQAKLDGSEVRLDDGWCGSVTGRCSRWMWKMVGSLLRDVSFTVPWFGVRARVDVVSCRTRMVAHAVSMVAQVSRD
jgi:hypothetical protein